jgi:nucleotide-binding universal stress UspA family protein
VLASLLAGVTSAELMLIGVHEEPIVNVVLPAEVGWTTTKRQARATLIETRDLLAPDARIRVQSDTLVWRALRHVARVEHRDLLVVGSGRHAAKGQVKIGPTARDLLCHLECPLAIAPRGMRNRDRPRLERIGVGFDRGAEAQAALKMAGSLALSASATLVVCAIADDRILGGLANEEDTFGGIDIMASEVSSLSDDATAAARATGVPVAVTANAGVPADRLLAFAAAVDLLVIGSSRSGPPGRVNLGSTGRALADRAACPLLVIPRPEPTR